MVHAQNQRNCQSKASYTLQRIHEVWHFSKTKKGLFKDYVNMWWKIKQEASGWPKDDMTEEEKDQYIDDYFEHEGILLEKDKNRIQPRITHSSQTNAEF